MREASKQAPDCPECGLDGICADCCMAGKVVPQSATDLCDPYHEAVVRAEAAEARLKQAIRHLGEVAAALLNKKYDGFTYVPDTLAAEVRQMREERDALRKDKRRLDEMERLLKISGNPYGTDNRFTHICCEIGSNHGSGEGALWMDSISASHGHNDPTMISRKSIRETLDAALERIGK